MLLFIYLSSIFTLLTAIIVLKRVKSGQKVRYKVDLYFIISRSVIVSNSGASIGHQRENAAGLMSTFKPGTTRFVFSLQFSLLLMS